MQQSKLRLVMIVQLVVVPMFVPFRRVVPLPLCFLGQKLVVGFQFAVIQLPFCLQEVRQAAAFYMGVLSLGQLHIHKVPSLFPTTHIFSRILGK
jgi:uncharacterized membrane protein